ncbi:hypothetical protein EMN47_15075 [Prolixibacteraceae bacterium JC049]|nr:hypothetical protein [Prolixibacteraceae bacterium JC049]
MKYLLSFLIFLIGISCGLEQSKKRERIVVHCGAEQIEGEHFLSDSTRFHLSNAAARVNTEAYQGDYSLKLTNANPFGMSLMLPDVKAGDEVAISVWRKGEEKGYVCASKKENSDFYKSTNKVVAEAGDWKQLKLEFSIPENYGDKELKIYLWNAGEKEVYFDDLVIDIKPKIQQQEELAYDPKDAIKIFIDDQGMQKLRLKRAMAIENGLLESGDDDWVKGIIFYKNKFLNARLRLKGDHLDHLQGSKWSFRVKLKGDGTFKGMRTFSIQTPAARNYLHEWFFHKALEQEDMLTTRYGFAPVMLNGRSLGLYAWEEHFEKQLVEYKNRREGPILKLTDDAYWLDQKVKKKFEVDYTIPSYDASVIVPFGAGRVVGDTLKMKQFNEGKNLYFQYKYAYAKASDVFDVRKMAQYYAMMDATNSYHSEHWFNQRYYYNPVLCKLEPISFDCFADVGIFDYYGANLLAEKAKTELITRHLKLFADKEFQNEYFHYLKEYSSEAFWKKMYDENREELVKLNGAIALEFPKYKFDINQFYKIAQQAREALDSFPDRKIFDQFDDRIMGVRNNYKGKAEMELFPHLVHAYLNGTNEVEVHNFFSDSIEIVGVGKKESFIQNTIGGVTVLPANSRKKYIGKVQTELDNAKYLFLKVRGQSQVVSIYPWPAPQKISSYQQLLKTASNPFLERNDTVYIAGDNVVNSPVLITKNKTVVIAAGAKIDFVQGSTFISYSPIFAQGEKGNPISITSTDNSCKGFNILQAKVRSELNHISFDGLSNLNYGGWVTPCAVCFYESDVTMNGVTFKNNYNCDDALNVVRADFNVENCRFENTFADAFDSDFCTGVVRNTVFEKPGNDAIDFSGSQVLIEKCTINNVVDKGISGGEKSHLKVKNCTVNGAKIGVASKDQSIVEIDRSILENVTYGLVAFQKKPEYGAGTIKAQNIKVKKYLFMHLVEEKSMLYLNEKEIFGKEPKVAERFY